MNKIFSIDGLQFFTANVCIIEMVGTGRDLSDNDKKTGQVATCPYVTFDLSLLKRQFVNTRIEEDNKFKNKNTNQLYLLIYCIQC